MKKIFYAAVLTAGVLNAEQEEIKLNGLYLGAGVNVNEDKAKCKVREDANISLNIAGVNVPISLYKGDKFSEQKDVSYGIHGIFGYSYLFANRFFCAIEQEIGWARHPNKMRNILFKSENRVVKPWEFTTLARLGYGFKSFPGVIYLSGGIKVLKTDSDDSKTLVSPSFGMGYQYAVSTHWSLRGDVLYTHVSSFNFKTNNMPCKGKGHRLSGAISLIYTF